LTAAISSGVNAASLKLKLRFPEQRAAISPSRGDFGGAGFETALLIVGFMVVAEEFAWAETWELLDKRTLTGLTSFGFVSSCCLTEGTAIVIWGDGLVA
jgi:hypothetical protein